jgi:hypothetical protein
MKELSLEQELSAMSKIVDILTPFPKAQRDRISKWSLERVNSQAQRRNISDLRTIKGVTEDE